MDKNVLLAIALCGLLLVAYVFVTRKYFPPPQEEPVSEETDRQELVGPVETGRETPTEPVFEPVVGPQEEIEEVEEERPITAEVELVRDIVLENDVLSTLWTNQGAALTSATLKKYKAPERREDALELLQSQETGPFYLALGIPGTTYPIENLRYTVKEISPERIVFETTLQNGLRITKIAALPTGKYHVNVTILLENMSNTRINTRYTFTAATGILREGDLRYDMATVTRVDVGRGSVYRQHPKDLEELETPDRNDSEGISWAGINNKYFAAVLLPDTSEYVEATISQMGDNPEGAEMLNMTINLETTNLAIPPQGTERHEYKYYIGPKKGEVLSQYGNLITLIDYGFTSVICRYLIKILNFFYSITHNYGVSILLLTLLVKSILFPLTKKSQVSMYRMQRLQPEVNKLREKYKRDKQKLGQEQMALFKKHGVNPMGGCLPMLLQLPVFLALFSTLRVSFEMRHAPFVLWINDLSRPDTLAYLPFTLPIIGNMFNILPLIMTAASFIQTRLTPKSTDPQQQAQQKMMAFMPLIFAFILYTMPSGLTLYWTTSTILSIGEQLLIRKIVKKIK